MFVFIHIPKTAGNTLNRLAVSGVGKGCACIINDAGELDAKLPASRDSTVLEFDYIGGHIKLSTLEARLTCYTLPRPPVLGTIFRDPLARAFSYYLFVLRTPAMGRFRDAVLGKDFDYFFDYAYDNMFWVLRDAQCVLISGERSADAATKILEKKFTVFGISERFLQFYEQVQSAAPFIQWPRDIAPHVGNVAPATLDPEDVGRGQKPPNWRATIRTVTIRKIEE